MSPGPVFLPLTIRGQHLPKLHTPVTHHTPSCSPSSWTMYTPHSCYSAYWNCACICFVTLCFSRWGHMHCVPFLCPSRLPAFFFFCLVGLFVVYSNIFLQLDPDPVLPRCLFLPFHDRIPNSKNRSSREASQCPPGRPENWGLCQGLHGSGSPVRYGKDHPHAHLLGRHGWDLQIPDALLGPRGVAGGLHQSGSEFERLSLQSSISCRACSVLWAHRVRCRARSVQNNLMQCATYGLSTDRLTPPPPHTHPSTSAAMLASLIRLFSQTQPLDMTLSTCTQLLWSTMVRPVLSWSCPIKLLCSLSHSAVAQFRGLGELLIAYVIFM